MKKIKGLQELLEALPHCSGEEYLKLAHGMKIDSSELAEYAFWSPDSYTRNCLARSDKYELLLLCWERHQETPIHCHGGEECWVYTLEGNLMEKRYKQKGDKDLPYEVQRENLQTGSISYMNDNMGFHSLHNIGSERAMTLHLYMNPIDRCRIYHPEEERFVLTELSYDSVSGEVLAS